jgi:hypothetical protein
MRVSKILSFSVVILLITVVFAGVVTVPAAAPASGVMDVFVRGGDNGLWERTYNNGWLSWTSISGT